MKNKAGEEKVGKEYICVVDRGTTNVKAVLFDLNGNEIYISNVASQIPTVLHPGWFEQDMNLIWKSAAEAICKCVNYLKKCDKIIGISVTGQGSGIYVTDKEGRPARQGITSLDTRSGKLIEKLRKTGIQEWWKAHTYKNLGKESPLAHMLWIKQNEPEVYKNIEHILFSKDWVRYCLTGEYATDITDTSPNGMLGLNEKTYMLEGLEKLGISDKEHTLPKILRSHEIAGYVTKTAAKETGLEVGIPVLTGAHDMMACCLGIGKVSNDFLLFTIGTWGGNYMITPKRREGISSNPHMIEGSYVTVYMDGNSGAVLDRMLRMLYACPGKEIQVSDYYSRAEIQARNAQYDDLIFLPYLFEALNEGNAGAKIVGLKNWHTQDDLIAAVYEGIVMHHFERVQNKLDDASKAEMLYLGGGGGKSELFAQLFADMFNKPVQIPDCDELASRGPALSALYGLGVKESFQDILIPVRVKKTYEPNQENHKFMEEKFNKFQDLINGTKGGEKE